jgi:hypothetical protein
VPLITPLPGGTFGFGCGAGGSLQPANSTNAGRKAALHNH